MKTLTINTKDPKVVRVGLMDNQNLISEKQEENQFGSQALLPLIIKLLEDNNLDFANLSEVLVEEGPGSYTGLRVGASVAQAIGFILNIPVNGKLNKPVQLRYTE
jgi:tRNA threonylcarbamoyl adenosine modification protein YeaZ